MKLLLIEDNKQLSDALDAVLRRERYLVETAADGATGLELAMTGLYDLILLDILLPVKSGWDVLRELRAAEVKTPVILLSALGRETDKINGLDWGADDYLSKPFSNLELLARIRAVTRRKGEFYLDDALTFGTVSLSLSRHCLEGNGKSVNLSVKEFEIMRYLMEKPSFVAEKENLIAKIWGFDEYESNSLEVYISFLRKKLNFLEADFTITAVRGVGYQLVKKQ